MDILTYNVRSLVSYSRRIDLINTLKCNKIDVAFLQETRLSSIQTISLENYSIIRDNSSIDVAIILKENFSSEYIC
ncbi:hypothetical protein CVS40_12898 [Lucilia cuprina]|nr:hypothetical protein CVS40_12898 [Lucilia cuprina]